MIVVLTILSLAIIFNAALLYMRLLRQPPIIALPPIEIKVPSEVRFVHVAEASANAEPTDPMPGAVYDYCAAESETIARDARLRHARSLRMELGSWDAAFRALQLEDSQ